MDSRTKIVDLDEALRRCGNEAIVLAGYFDPLTVAHAVRVRELAAKGKRIIVLVDSPPDPLLEARARAELVAGLAGVSCVVIGGAALLNGMGELPFVRDEEQDLKRRAKLMELVRRKHQ